MKRVTPHLLMISTICIAAWQLYPAFAAGAKLSYLSDDYHWLYNIRMPEGLLPIDYWNRYSPSGFALLSLFRSVFGWDPLPIHVFSAALHILNAVLISLVTRQLTRNIYATTATFILFLSFRFIYEPVFWTSASIFYIPALTFAIAGTLVLLISKDGKLTTPQFIGLLACYTLSISFHEQAIAFIVVWMALWIGRMQSIPTLQTVWVEYRTSIYLYSLMAAIALSLLIIKHVCTSNMCILDSSPQVRLINYMRMHLYAFLHLSITDWSFRNPLFAVTGLMILLLTPVSVALLTTKYRMYGALVIGAQALILPPVLYSGICARYIYIPGAVASILLGMGLAAGSGKLHKTLSRIIRPFRAETLSIAALCIPLLLISISDSKFLINRTREWTAASHLSDSIIAESVDLIAHHPSHSTVVFVNLPDGLSSWFEPAYLFRMGTRGAMLHAIEESHCLQHPIRIRELGRSAAYNLPDKPADPALIKELVSNKANLVIEYTGKQPLCRVLTQDKDVNGR